MELFLNKLIAASILAVVAEACLPEGAIAGTAKRVISLAMLAMIALPIAELLS